MIKIQCFVYDSNGMLRVRLKRNVTCLIKWNVTCMIKMKYYVYD